MRRKITTTLIIFTVACIGWWTASFVLSHKKVAFTLAGNDYSLQIRDTDGKELKTIDSSQDVTLRTGDYLYNIVGEGYDGKSVPFSIKGDIEIGVQPEYLESYLPQLVEKEKGNALNLLNTAYPTVGKIIITDFSLTKNIQWGYGKLQLGGNTTNIYRFILQRDGENWKIHISPRIVISKSDAKDVPEEILYSLY